MIRCKNCSISLESGDPWHKKSLLCTYCAEVLECDGIYNKTYAAERRKYYREKEAKDQWNKRDHTCTFTKPAEVESPPEPIKPPEPMPEVPENVTAMLGNLF